MRIPYTSLAAFKAKASLLESLLNLKGRRRSLELLSQLSGYASYHEVSHTEFAPGPTPTVDQVATQLREAIPEVSPVEAQRVAEALGLHTLEAGAGAKPKTSLEKEFDALYVTKTPIDKKALTKFEFPEEQRDSMLQPPSFDPDDHAKTLQQVRASQFHLRSSEPCPQHPDLPQVRFFGDEAGAEYKPSNGELSDWWGEHISYVLYPKYARKKPPKRLSELDGDILWNFWQNPTEEVAAAHPVLSKIPDVVRLAQLWRPYHEALYAQETAHNQPKFTVLMGDIPVPPGVDWAPADTRLYCSLAFKQSVAAELDGDDDMSIWEYSGCFMLAKKGSKRYQPIALITGTHITPFSSDGDFQGVDSEFFADMMDDHSSMLNDVWKVLQYQYFRDEGFNDVEEFVDERPGCSFTVASLEITPELRGKGLAPLLLNLFTDTVARYPVSELDAGWQEALGLPDTEDDESPGIALGTPGVLIFPVEGTKPHEQPLGPASVLLMRSPLKVDALNKDPKIERSKEKLTAHFLAMKDKVAADIVVYDPWEYPMT